MNTTEGPAPVSNRMVIEFDGDVEVKGLHAIPVPSSHDLTEPKIAYSIDEAAAICSISRNKLFDYIAAGKLRSRRNGRMHLITRADLEAFIDSLPTDYEGE